MCIAPVCNACESDEGTEFPVAVITDSCEPPHRWGTLNVGLLQEQ